MKTADEWKIDFPKMKNISLFFAAYLNTQEKLFI